jgi:hypothetical protein
VAASLVNHPTNNTIDLQVTSVGMLWTQAFSNAVPVNAAVTVAFYLLRGPCRRCKAHVGLVAEASLVGAGAFFHPLSKR